MSSDLAKGFQSYFSEQTPDFWLSFLRTEDARQNPVFQQLAEKLSKRPWLIAHPGYEQEKSHFYAWLADTFMPWPRARSEQGDALADLTVYHEWLHMLTHPRGYKDPLDWMTGNRCNESQVSIETEMLARVRIPGLQEKAFQNRPIWAERLEIGKEQLFKNRPQDEARMNRLLDLLNQPGREHDLYEKSGGQFLLSEKDDTFWGFTHRELWALRRGVGLWPDANDPIESQMHVYEALSDAWLLRWVAPAKEIEEHRLDLQSRSLKGEGESAIEDFNDWINSRRGEHGIPFEYLALEASPAVALPKPEISSQRSFKR